MRVSSGRLKKDAWSRMLFGGLAPLLVALATQQACDEQLDSVESPNIIDNVDLPGGTVIRAEPASLSLGEVEAGKRVTGTIRLINSGIVPITVLKISSTCGCTVATLETKVIKPASSVDLSVTVRSTGRASSRINKRITVLFEGDTEPLRIPVTAAIDRSSIAADMAAGQRDSAMGDGTSTPYQPGRRGGAISVTPRRLSFGVVEPGKIATRTVRLHGASSCRVCEPVVGCDDLGVFVELSDWHRDGNDVVLELAVVAPQLSDGGSAADISDRIDGTSVRVRNEVEISYGDATATLVAYAQVGATNEPQE